MAYKASPLQKPAHRFRQIKADIYKRPESPECFDEIEGKLISADIYFDESIDRRIKELVSLVAPGYQLITWWLVDQEHEEF